MKILVNGSAMRPSDATKRPRSASLAAARQFTKTKYLEHKGYRVAHYSNEDVNRSFYSVCEDILAIIDGLK